MKSASSELDDLLKRGVDIKIFKGKKAAGGAYPWMVSFVDRDRPREATCGGALVAPQWILTAAHCKLKPSEDLAILGRINLDSAVGSEKALDRFCASPTGDDVALVHLTTAATEAYVDLYPRPDATLVVGSQIRIMGWGLTEGSSRSRHLLYTDIPVISRSNCEANLPTGIKPCANCICAWDQGGIADACSWDSGGPAVVKMPGGLNYVQVGVIAASAGCGRVPGIYPFAPSHSEWIEKTVAGPPAAAVCRVG